MLKSIELLDVITDIEDSERFKDATSFLIGFLGPDIDKLSDVDFAKLIEGIKSYNLSLVPETTEAKR